MYFDAIALAKKQITRDRAATKGRRGLFEHKMERMTASPLAFLRGAAPLFYELLETCPELARGPEGKGFITGDLHLENFGAFKPHAHFEDHEEAVFDLNDFDDCNVAPLRFDVLRLTTSLMLAGREIGKAGPETLILCGELLDAYAANLHRGVKGKGGLPAPPPVVRVLLARASMRTRRALLDARTEVVKGERRFVRGLRYADLPREVSKAVPEAFARYARAIDKAHRPKKHALDVVDAAFRVAGTGSLGCLRIAVLVRGKGGRDGHFIFDMKQEGSPSSSGLAKPPKKMSGAERVLAGLHACLSSPPLLAGTTKLRGVPMLVRRLSPQEDKLDWTHIDPAELPALARYLGALVGRAHRKGATKLPKKAWKRADLTTIQEHAIRLAGVHEATYLALCHLVRSGHV